MARRQDNASNEVEPTPLQQEPQPGTDDVRGRAEEADADEFEEMEGFGDEEDLDEDDDEGSY